MAASFTEINFLYDLRLYLNATEEAIRYWKEFYDYFPLSVLGRVRYVGYPSAFFTQHLPLIHGHPDAPEVALTFKEKKDGSWVTANAQGVGYGVPFKVEAEFREPPTEKPVVVQLNWDETQAPIGVTVKPVSDDDKLFRSDELSLNYENGRAVLTRIRQ